MPGTLPLTSRYAITTSGSSRTGAAPIRQESRKKSAEGQRGGRRVVEFLQFTLSGISFGMIYAAIALSLVLIWRGTRLLNFAQGGMAMLTTYIAIEVIYKTHSYWAGFVIALVAGLILGAASELTVVRPTTGKPALNAVIVTIGLLIFFE